MVDFTGKKMNWVGISPQVTYMKCEVLVCTFPFSGYTFACAVGSQKQEDFIYALVKTRQRCLIIPGNPEHAVCKYPLCVDEMLIDFLDAPFSGSVAIIHFLNRDAIKEIHYCIITSLEPLSEIQI